MRRLIRGSPEQESAYKGSVKPELQATTVASDANQDPQNRPPRVPYPRPKSGPRLAWERMLARTRRSATTVFVSSLSRFHRLRLPRPAATAFREPVRQFRGQGLAIQAAGTAVAFGLWWHFEIPGAIVGLVVATLAYVVGLAKSKPWRCATCRTPLATAEVRVCPGCGARLVGSVTTKVLPQHN